MWRSWYPEHARPLAQYVLDQAQITYPSPAQSPPTAGLTLNLQGPVFRVQLIPGKGKGVVAAQHIHRGDLVLIESPAFVYTPNIPPPGIMALYDQLPVGAQEALSELTTYTPTQEQEPTYQEIMFKDFLERLDTNAFDITYAGEELLGVFPRASRINHSCLPNCTRHFFTDVFPRFEFRAVQDIEPGEEITISYIQPFQVRAERHTYLQEHWGFSCQCGACSLRGAALVQSDARREELYHVAYNSIDPVKAAATMQRALDLLDKEGYYSARSQFFSHGLQALRAAKDVDVAALAYWTALAADVFSIERGSESQLAKEAREDLRRISGSQ